MRNWKGWKSRKQTHFDSSSRLPELAANQLVNLDNFHLITLMWKQIERRNCICSCMMLHGKKWGRRKVLSCKTFKVLQNSEHLELVVCPTVPTKEHPTGWVKVKILCILGNKKFKSEIENFPLMIYHHKNVLSMYGNVYSKWPQNPKDKPSSKIIFISKRWFVHAWVFDTTEGIEIKLLNPLLKLRESIV